VLLFPVTYPSEPPVVRLCNWIRHPNVFGGVQRGTGQRTALMYPYLCLDMLSKGLPQPYAGWSSSYTVSSILMQIQSFLVRHLQCTRCAPPLPLPPPRLS
jgi:ubiquitin-protein ligase